MTGVICSKCWKASNTPQYPLCDDNQCPGRQTFKPMEKSQCTMHMLQDRCEHRWDGPWVDHDDGRGGSVTCSKCGMDAMSWSMRVGP